MKKKFLILFCIVGVISVFFLSNRVLRLVFKEKIWVHRVNSIEKYLEVHSVFRGIELDVVFNSEKGYFDINHPPVKSIDLSLLKFLKSLPINADYNYWVDFKNLNKENMEQSFNRLKFIVETFNLKPENIIVESTRPEFLKLFKSYSFKTSYYLPIGLHKLEKDSLASNLSTIKKIYEDTKLHYLSFNYRDYKIINSNFPNAKKITWSLNNKFLNRLKARFSLYNILLDKNVEVVLQSYSVKVGDR
jgi:heptose-I-phosphate ethanolaminephosphotransferase